jgi:quinol monooxygenase YgiN
MSLETNATPVVAVGIARARRGREEELGRRMAALIAPTRIEAGCVDYDLFRSIEDSAVWMFLEVWRSQADLDAHVRSEHLQAFLRYKDDVITGKPDSYRFVRVSATMSDETDQRG